MNVAQLFNLETQSKLSFPLGKWCCKSSSYRVAYICSSMQSSDLYDQHHNSIANLTSIGCHSIYKKVPIIHIGVIITSQPASQKCLLQMNNSCL